MGPKKHMPECRRCGTCCEKGGPGFHIEDRVLIEEGVIHTRYLYTIRIGEQVRDNILDELTVADAEIIKIKGRDASWTCHFYDAEGQVCTIYAKRPLECRVLNCRDTGEIRSLYSRERLSRKDLLQGIGGLWPLIEDHEQRCAYDKMTRAMQDLEGGFQKHAMTAVMQMIRYDAEIRNLVVEKGGVEPAMTDFLFGRPFSRTLHMYGYKVTMNQGKFGLAKL